MKIVNLFNEQTAYAALNPKKDGTITEVVPGIFDCFLCGKHQKGFAISVEKHGMLCMDCGKAIAAEVG